jgi:hypothetical protein
VHLKLDGFHSLTATSCDASQAWWFWFAHRATLQRASLGLARFRYTLLGLARTICIQCAMYKRYFGKPIPKYTVIYGAYVRFWPPLCIQLINGISAVLPVRHMAPTD